MSKTVSARPARPQNTPLSKNAARGLVLGGRGGPEDELLESGQEEVFSRTEVELGRIEHQSGAGGAASDPLPED